jgi:hypothetical protein
MKKTWIQKKWVKVPAAVLVMAGLILAMFYLRFEPAKNMSWGLTYSPGYAEYLGLDPLGTFNEILNDLQPQHVRLVTYWENIEQQPGQFDFTAIDGLLELAEAHHTDVILVIGHKQPRWPECHHPVWFEQLSSSAQRQAILDFVTAEVNHFKTFSVISRWQVENEPVFNYGLNCAPHSRTELAAEVGLVKSLDNRPIVLTDSGEKGDWFRVAKMADIFGSTMYRTVYNPQRGGYVSYGLPPEFYRVRAGMLQIFTRVPAIIGVELQAEPWFAHDIHETPLPEQYQLMNAQMFQDNVAYARRVGFSENYFWGAEWWYWLKNIQHDQSMVRAAQKIFHP